MGAKVVDIGKKKPSGKLVAAIIIVILAIIVIVSSVAIVPAGCTGVVTTFGKVSENAYNEGLHFKIPFAQEVITISNKIQVYEADADAVSKDLQSVSSKIAVNYRIMNDYSASIYKNIGSDYQSVVLMPTVQESMKSVCAKYTAEQLITMRAQVGDEIKTELENRVEEYGIQIEKFNIVNFEFSEEFNAAIEAKQVAEQNLLKTKTEQEQAIVIANAEAEKKVIAAEAEATSIKTKADAQAEANKTLTASLTDELIKYQTIDKWDGVLPKVAGSANPLVALDLNEDTAENAE
ncbi:MAG: SPFH domain-containing protein [Ruminococcus sp.]|nr:SPFH domain-containing protein [Ruminococcus sp.]